MDEEKRIVDGVNQIKNDIKEAGVISAVNFGTNILWESISKNKEILTSLQEVVKRLNDEEFSVDLISSGQVTTPQVILKIQMKQKSE